MSSKVHDVAVVGAGASGLMAARVLLLHEKDVIVLEARKRKGGRAFSFPVQNKMSYSFSDIAHEADASDGNENCMVDLGCSSIHGVNDDGNSVWSLALHHGIKVPDVRSGITRHETNYANTLICPWFHDGVRLSQRDVYLAHQFHNAILARISGYATRSPKKAIRQNLQLVYNSFKKEVLETFSLSLTTEVSQILNKIRNRYYGYCTHVRNQSCQDFVGMGYTIDEESQFDDDFMDGQAAAIDKFLTKGNTHRIVHLSHLSTSQNWGSDITPVDGYGSFVSNVIGANIDVLFEKVICEISVFKHSGAEILKLKCHDETVYYAKKVIMTVPLAVLKTEIQKSRIDFYPKLSVRKRRLIETFGVGSHDKVILKYQDKDVFWPKSALQINCLHNSIMFSNLHALGKRGLILAHLFASNTGEPDLYAMSDEQVSLYVQKLLWNSISYEVSKSKYKGATCTTRTVFKNAERRDQILSNFKEYEDKHEVYFSEMPTPIASVVTRWRDDPYALGSYSYCPVGFNIADISLWRMPEKMGTEKNLLFFAGEHTVNGSEGWQCAHGAANSGVRAAYYVLTDDISDRPISDLFQYISFLHHPRNKSRPSISTSSPYVLKSEYMDLKSEFCALKQRVRAIENENIELKSAILKFTQKKVIPDEIYKLGEYDDNNIAPDTLDSEAIEPMEKSLRKAQHQQNRMMMQNNLASVSSFVKESVDSDGNRHVSFKVILVHPEEKTWRLIQPIVHKGVRRSRIRCMHKNENEQAHQTFNVCSKCRRYICVAHWKDGTHFKTCQPYVPKVEADQATNSKPKGKRGRPFQVYDGPI